MANLLPFESLLELYILFLYGKGKLRLFICFTSNYFCMMLQSFNFSYFIFQFLLYYKDIIKLYFLDLINFGGKVT